VSAVLPTAPASTTPYRDRKRLLWALPILVTLIAAAGPAAHLMGATSQGWFFLAAATLYLGTVLVDTVIGEDLSNPPESEVPRLEAQGYYRWVIYGAMIAMWGVTLFDLHYIATHDLPWYSELITIITCGTLLGAAGLAMSHELGHKKEWLPRKVALFQAALVGYGHFNVEHNRGHHRHVATPDDPASSQMGESIYRFVLREYPGAFLRGWDSEAERLGRLGKSPWSLNNEILQGALITLLVYGTIVATLGTKLIPAIIVIMMWGSFQLTSANYIEHYGLLRLKLPNGRYEHCKPHHSWNSNLIASNIITYHLQRHSDHHANPTRSYQSLRNFEDLPTLPTGYLGMFLAAYVPPIWFAIMDKRVIAATGGDVDRINFLPGKRAKLIEKFNLKSAAKVQAQA
jgi:alkane 1-monooxygenase